MAYDSTYNYEHTEKCNAQSYSSIKSRTNARKREKEAKKKQEIALVLSYFVMSCLVLSSCLVSSCLVPCSSCLVVSYFVQIRTNICTE
jgi:hypothetical protein